MANKIPNGIRLYAPEGTELVPQALPLVAERQQSALKFSANLSLLFAELELLDRFKAAKEKGFSAVEIQFPYSLPPEKIADVVAANQLKLVQFNVAADDLMQGGEGLASVPEKKVQFQEALAQTVAYARILKPEVINILPGRCLDEHRLPDYLATFKTNLLSAAEVLQPLGIKAVFEAINTKDMPAFIIHSGEQMLAIINQLQHPNLFMQYDIYHMHLMGENVADFIAKHADKIGHIQFADCPGRGQPGTGEIDFRRVFSVIEKSKYSGWCGAEYKPAAMVCESFGWFSKYPL